MMILPLGLVHLITSFMRHNYITVDPIGSQVKHDNLKREFWIDMAVFFMLVHVGFAVHPLNEGSNKSSKVERAS